MYLARICGGIETVERVDDFEIYFVDWRAVRRPRQPRAWKFQKPCEGAAAFSQSPEGAIASARLKLDEEAVRAVFQPKRESA